MREQERTQKPSPDRRVWGESGHKSKKSEERVGFTNWMKVNGRKTTHHASSNSQKPRVKIIDGLENVSRHIATVSTIWADYGPLL